MYTVALEMLAVPLGLRPAEQPVGGTVPTEPGGSRFGREYEVVFTLSH